VPYRLAQATELDEMKHKNNEILLQYQVKKHGSSQLSSWQMSYV
jgi:hypothetical protein